MQTTYARFSHSLSESLQLKNTPVAVCFTDRVPEGVRSYSGNAPAGCYFWQEASAGPFSTTASDHALCSIGVYTHNLDMPGAVEQDLQDALHVFGDLGYVRPEDLPLIPTVPTRAKHVVYAPLAETPIDPSVVLLLVQANQTLILSEASQQVEGGFPPALGRPACAVVPQIVKSGRAALTLGCCGARAYLDTFTPDIAIFGMPGANLAAYVERIEALAGANAMLTRFHRLRLEAVKAGARPTIQESLAALQMVT